MADYIEVGPMLTVRDVVRLLHIHSNTVRRWSDQGILKAYRITRRGDRRFRREDIARYLAELNGDGSNKVSPDSLVAAKTSSIPAIFGFD